MKEVIYINNKPEEKAMTFTEFCEGKITIVASGFSASDTPNLEIGEKLNDIAIQYAAHLSTQKKEDKSVELRSILTDQGWIDQEFNYAQMFDKIVHLGHYDDGKDMFACYKSEKISIYKGHLNSGKY